MTARYSWPYASGNVTALARYRYHSDYQNNPALALSKVFNTTTLDVAVAYRWKNWTFTLFSNNVLDKRYPRQREPGVRLAVRQRADARTSTGACHVTARANGSADKHALQPGETHGAHH
ncbi:MAG: hypothetical protein CMD83_15265 [Gammaproteobacteria bacterium]|nr:hypothetical protein [Gammaproteobacteria bacterium]